MCILVKSITFINIYANNYKTRIIKNLAENTINFYRFKQKTCD